MTFAPTCAIRTAVVEGPSPVAATEPISGLGSPAKGAFSSSSGQKSFRSDWQAQLSSQIEADGGVAAAKPLKPEDPEVESSLRIPTADSGASHAAASLRSGPQAWIHAVTRQEAPIAEVLIAARNIAPRVEFAPRTTESLTRLDPERLARPEKAKAVAPASAIETSLPVSHLPSPPTPLAMPAGSLLTFPANSVSSLSEPPVLTMPQERPNPIAPPVSVSQPMTSLAPSPVGAVEFDVRPEAVAGHLELPASHPVEAQDVVPPRSEAHIASIAPSDFHVRESATPAPTNPAASTPSTIHIEAPVPSPAAPPAAASRPEDTVLPRSAPAPTVLPSLPGISRSALDQTSAPAAASSILLPPAPLPVELPASALSGAPMRRAGRDPATPTAAIASHVAVSAPAQSPIGLADASGTIRVPQAALRSDANLSGNNGALNNPTGPHEIFSALESQPGPGSPQWTHAGGQRAEAGFEDPALGWIGVRAGMSGGSVHAALVPGSASAADELGRHLDGLTNYLAEQRTPVASLAVSTHQSRGTDAESRSGTGPGTSPDSQQGSRQDPQQGAQQNARQGAGQSAQSQSSSHAESVSAIGRSRSEPATGLPEANQGAGSAFTAPRIPEGHISVMA